MPLDHGRESVFGLLAPRGEETVQECGITQAPDGPAPHQRPQVLNRRAGWSSGHLLSPRMAKALLSPTLRDTGISRKNASLEAEEHDGFVPHISTGGTGSPMRSQAALR